MKINSSMVPLERRESMMSSQSETEETEFDPDAITVPAPSEDTLDSQKPRLKGKKFCVMPPRNLDSDLSGLCSIMWSEVTTVTYVIMNLTTEVVWNVTRKLFILKLFGLLLAEL